MPYHEIRHAGEFQMRQDLKGEKVTAEDVPELHIRVDFGYFYFFRVRKQLHQNDFSPA